MNKRAIILSILAAACLAAGCKSDEERAGEAAYNYLYAMANYDVDAAEPYATEEVRNTTLIMARRLTLAVGEAYVKSDTPATIELTGLEFTSDTTATASYHKVTPIKDMTGTLELRKRHRKWLAHATIPVVHDNGFAAPAVPQGGKRIRDAAEFPALQKKVKNQ